MYIRNGLVYDGRPLRLIPEHGTPEREGAWIRFKDKCPDAHPKLEQKAFMNFLYDEAEQRMDREAKAKHNPQQSFPEHTEHGLNGGYSLRIKSAGIFSFRVDVVSPDGHEIAKDALLIRGIARTFGDPLAGWHSKVRILNEENIIESHIERISVRKAG